MAFLSMSLNPCSFKWVLIVAFLFFTFLPHKSVGLQWSRRGGRGVKEMKFLEKGKSKSYEEVKKMVIGSRPPECENKCNTCRPCTAAAVVPVHRMKGFKAFYELSQVDEDSYYLLSWKCQCRNKVYQP